MLFTILLFPLVSANTIVQQFDNGASGDVLEWRRDSTQYYAGNDFVANATGTITGVQLMLNKGGSPTGNVWLAIYNADGSGNPTTLVANSSTTVPANTVTTTNLKYYGWNFSGFTITNGQRYAFVVSTEGIGIDATNWVRGQGASYTGTDIMKASNTFSWSVVSSNFQVAYRLWAGSGGGSATNSTFTAFNFYNNSPVNSFCINITGNFTCTTNGTATVTTILTNSTQLWTVEYRSNESGGYFNTTYAGVNVSSNVNRSMAQSVVGFSATEKVTGNIISATFNTSLLTNQTHYFNNQNRNVSAVANGYYTKTVQYNVTPLTSSTYVFTEMVNTIFNVSSQDYSGYRIRNYSATVSNEQYGFSETSSTTNGSLSFNLARGVLYNLSITSFDENSSYMIGNFLNINASSNYVFNYSVLNVTFTNPLSGFTIPNAIAQINRSPSAAFNETASGTSAYFLVNTTSTYTIRGYAAGYNSNFSSVTPGVNGFVSVNVNLLPNNSINFSVFNVSSLAYVNTTTTITLTCGSNTTTTTTSNSVLFANLSPCTYDITASASGFNLYNSNVTVGDNTYQTFDIYLNPSSSSQTLFSIKNNRTLESIPGVSMFVETKPGTSSTYYPVGYLFSDINGYVPLQYTPLQTYRFTVIEEGYHTVTFVLSPIALSSYEVYITPVETVPITNDYQDIVVEVLPSTLNNNQQANFTYYVSAPRGNLQAFNFTISTNINASTFTNQSTSAYGDILRTSFYLNASNYANATIYFQYRYLLSNGVEKVFMKVYSIDNPQAGNMIYNQGNPYGMSLFSRIIVATLIVIFAVGISAFYTNVMGGLLVGIGVYAYLIYTGFLPGWIVVVSLIALLFIMWGYS